MGAKTWMLVYASQPVPAVLKSKPSLDREASKNLAQRLFPEYALEPLEDGALSYTCPPKEEIVIACFPGVTVVAATDFGIDYPSRLPGRFLDASLGDSVYLHAMHSVVDWFAFAVWQGGVLTRSLSLSPDSGVLEDKGPRLAFEQPYWDGKHPAVDPAEDDTYPFPFHPLELGEAALAHFFGYILEGIIDPSLVDAEDIATLRFKRTRLAPPPPKARPWWKFWSR